MSQMIDLSFVPEANGAKASQDACIPIFRREAVEDKAASLKAGHPIFRDQITVEIHSPGDKTSIPKHNVTGAPHDKFKLRWPAYWAAFEKGLKQVEVGTPVEFWPPASPALVKMLKASDIHTVESLSVWPETNAPRIPDFLRWQAKARDWLKSASGNADTVRLGEQLRIAQERIASLEQSNAGLRAALETGVVATAERAKRKYTKRTATDRPS